MAHENYSIKRTERFLGYDQYGEEYHETRLIMYVGPMLNMDVTDMTADQIAQNVRKLELMGFTHENAQ